MRDPECEILRLPDINGIKSSHLPVLVCNEGNVEVETSILPQEPATFASRMCHVADDR